MNLLPLPVGVIAWMLFSYISITDINASNKKQDHINIGTFKNSITRLISNKIEKDNGFNQYSYDIWVEGYFNNESSWHFSIGKSKDHNSDGKADWVSLDVRFICGSNYDESIVFGACPVILSNYYKKRVIKKWNISVLFKKCRCDYEYID